jgi:hypothetical protein
MDKTRIIIEIECGKVTCGECDGMENGACAIFGRSLVEDADDVYMRAPECLEAEKRMDEAMLRSAIAKAAAPQA